MNHDLKQHRKFFMLLRNANSIHLKDEIVSRFTNGRTTSSREMNTEEIIKANDCIELMIGGPVPGEDFKKGERMRRRIMSLCHQYGYTKFNVEMGKHIVDLERLDAWMLKYGYLHKSLNNYKYKELPRLVGQFQRVVYSYLNKL